MSLLCFLTVPIAVAACMRCITLQRQLRAAFVDGAYGILTRAGGEAAWRRMPCQPLAVIFTDLDGLHVLNDRLGYAEVNRRITCAFRSRRDDLPIAMRWFSGDEIVVVVPRADGLPAAARLLATLGDQELSGTFAVVTATTHDLAAEAGRAAALVQAAKRAGRRGTIIDGDAV